MRIYLIFLCILFAGIAGAQTTIHGEIVEDTTMHVRKLAPSGASNGQVLKWNSTTLRWEPAADAGGSGTVTSVGLAAPTQFAVSGSPVTTSGTLTFSWNSQTANTVLAAPDGSAGAPTFRSLVATDIPGLLSTKITDFDEAVDDRVDALLIDGTGISTTYNDAGNTLTITNTGDTDASNDLTTSTTFSGDVTGTYNATVVGDNSHNHDATSITTNIVSSVDGVTNDGGNIDLVAGSGITITPDDGANTITIAYTGSGSGNYQTLRDDGVAATQRAAANLVSNSDIAFTLTDDAANGETEITADIPADAINTTEIADDAVTAAKIASDAVGSAEIITGAVGAEEIIADAVGASELASTTVSAGTYGSATQVAQVTFDADGRATGATNVSISYAGANYQTVRDEGSNMTGRSAINFTPSTWITPVATDDGANNETEVQFQIINASVGSTQIADGSIQPVDVLTDMVASVDGVINDGGNIDLIAGSGITITPDDGANTITIAATGGGGTPGGDNADLQYNSSGSFAGSNNLEWDNAAVSLKVGAPSAGAGRIIAKGAGTSNATYLLQGYDSGNTEKMRLDNAGYFQGAGLGNVGYTYTGRFNMDARLYQPSNVTSTLTSGGTYNAELAGKFAPTSGTAEWDAATITGDVNQTGGASGITRGLSIQNNLISAFNFRGIETKAGYNYFGNGGVTPFSTYRLNTQGYGSSATAGPLLAMNGAGDPILCLNDNGWLSLGNVGSGVSCAFDASFHTNAIRLPHGTTAQRPGAPQNGMLRSNSSTNQIEAYVGGAWSNLSGGGGGSPGGSTTQVQYNNSSAFDGAANVTITTQENLNLAEYTTTAPNTPGAGTTTVFSQEVVPTKNRLASIGEEGVVETPAMSFISNGHFYFQPVGNGTTVSGILWSNSTTGTLTTANVATTNMFTSQRRLGYNSNAAAGSAAGTRHAFAQFYLGDAAGRGGFLGTWRYGIATNVSGSAAFVGFTASTGVLSNADPSSLTNIICMGKDAGDSNMQIMHNDGTGTATKVDLGANFSATSAATDWYEVTFFAKPNAGTVTYKVTNKSNGNVATGTLSTNLPTSTTLLAAQVWICNRAATGSVQIDLGRIIIECPNQ